MKIPSWLFRQTAEILESGGMTGMGTEAVISRGTHRCRIVPHQERVVTKDGSIVVSKAKALFPPTAPINSRCKVRFEGTDYQVLSSVPVMALSKYSHIEVLLG